MFAQTRLAVVQFTLVAVDLRNDGLLLRATRVAHLRHGSVANVHRLKHLLNLVNLEIVTQPGDSVLGNRCEFAACGTRQLSRLGASLVLVGVVISLEALLAERVTAQQHLRAAVRFETDHALQQVLERRREAIL